MTQDTLEQIIKRHIPFTHKKNNRGWEPILCRVCNDRGHKGPRAAFNFDNGGVAYNCFNCGHKAVYIPGSEEGITSDMETVLKSFGVPDNEWNIIILSHLRTNNNNKSNAKRSVQVTSSFPDEIPLPPYFYLLSEADANDKWAKVANWYLKETRNIDPTTYPFMLAFDTPESKEWVGRVVVPIFHQDKVIFYQGRAMLPTKKKYKSPPVPKDKVIYNLDKLFEGNEPIYIVEGWFDAFAIDGFAVFGNQLSKHQIEILNRSKRPKVVIPDRYGDGKKMAQQALKLGWSISLPDISTCKDMDEAVRRFGLLYVKNSLIENTVSGILADTYLELWCH